MKPFLETTANEKLNLLMNSEQEDAIKYLLHLDTEALLEMLGRIPHNKSKAISLIKDVLNSKGVVL